MYSGRRREVPRTDQDSILANVGLVKAMVVRTREMRGAYRSILLLQTLVDLCRLLEEVGLHLETISMNTRRKKIGEKQTNRHVEWQLLPPL
jgi:hypothetical protein